MSKGRFCMRVLDPDKGVGNFGKWLAYNIFCSGMSIKEFSDEIGISRVTISSHIRKKQRPSLSVVRMYCDYFGEGDMWRVYDAIANDWVK